VQALATGHARQGLDVSVISLLVPGNAAGHPFSRPLKPAGVRVHELEFPSKAVFRERRAVRELLRMICPDVVHTHWYRPDVLHATTARRLGIPTVTTEHGSSKLGGKTAVYEWIQRASFRRFQAIVAVSMPIAERLVLEGVPRSKVHLIPNGWAGGVDFLDRASARRRLGLPNDRPVVGYVGRLIPAKGPDVFVVSSREAVLAPPLANGIRCALTAPADSAERAERASKRLEADFTADQWLQRHETLYRAVSGLTT
jgi:glycosyltransferase involved in cell wall biosynthesis